MSELTKSLRDYHLQVCHDAAERIETLEKEIEDADIALEMAKRAWDWDAKRADAADVRTAELEALLREAMPFIRSTVVFSPTAQDRAIDLLARIDAALEAK